MIINQSANHVLKSDTFHTIVVWAIVSCSILLGVETFYPSGNRLFELFDIVFSIFFLIEILIRMLASGSLFNFFKLLDFSKSSNGKMQIKVDEVGFWNWFDFLIVLFATISMFKHIVEHPEFLIVSRLFRVLRIFRLLEVSNELKNVEKRIISIIPTVFSFVLLLGILIYIYAIIGVYLFEHRSFEQADFSTLPGAFMTLFQLMTLDGWTEVMNSTDSTMYSNWLIKGYFVSFVIFTAIISFNIFVAVLTSQVHEKMLVDAGKPKVSNDYLKGDNEYQEKKLDAILSEIKSLREEVHRLKSQ
ncbi:MAG: ion transporter [Cyclobacteriaceae bacterium]